MSGPHEKTIDLAAYRKRRKLATAKELQALYDRDVENALLVGDTWMIATASGVPSVEVAVCWLMAETPEDFEARVMVAIADLGPAARKMPTQEEVDAVLTK